MANIVENLSGADLQSVYPLFGETPVRMRCLFSSLIAQLVKNPPTNTGDQRDMASVPGSARYPGIGNDNPQTTVLA